MSDEEEEKEFVIKDRRHFTAEGEPLDKTEPEAKTEPEPEPEKTPPQETAGQEEEAEFGPLPEVTFSTFIFSLSTSVLLHLGEIPDPNTQQTSKNPGLAKQTIDILGMLKEKTKGNLEEDEANYLKIFFMNLE